jgi:hypothetical protein
MKCNLLFVLQYAYGTFRLADLNKVLTPQQLMHIFDTKNNHLILSGLIISLIGLITQYYIYHVTK